MKGMKRFGILLLSALAYQAEVGFFEHGALSKKRTSTLVTILVQVLVQQCLKQGRVLTTQQQRTKKNLVALHSKFSSKNIFVKCFGQLISVFPAKSEWTQCVPGEDCCVSTRFYLSFCRKNSTSCGCQKQPLTLCFSLLTPLTQAELLSQKVFYQN